MKLSHRVCFAGIGSRDTPMEILALMRELALFLAHRGFVLRSGGAFGADSAFKYAYTSVGAEAEIYLPRGILQDWWYEVAEYFHPAWERCSPYARRLHARNTPIVLGADREVDPISEFIVCWTKDGKASGGTGQALRIAAFYKIPVFNLAVEGDLVKLKNFLKSTYNVE